MIHTTRYRAIVGGAVDAMLEPFDELDRQIERDAWQLIAESVPALNGFGDVSLVDIAQILSPPIHEKLSSSFLILNRQRERYTFLTDEQLHDIANEEMKRERVRWETNIDETTGIYVFISLVESLVYKVGQAKNLRKRFTEGHLRYGNQKSDSNLIDYCKSSGANWPQCIRDKEFVALAFPFHGSCVEERCFLEFGLQTLLSPLLP